MKLNDCRPVIETMKTTTIFLAAVFVMFTQSVCAAESVVETFQNGLIEEESNQNLTVLGGVAEPVSASDGRCGFRTPTLRNLRHTAPYMHNGGLRTLRDVLDFYDQLAEAISETLDGEDATCNPRVRACDPWSYSTVGQI